MPIREMSHPQWDVTEEGDLVVLRLVVPYSKFGAVHAFFDPEAARALAAALAASEPEKES